jgi:hypothetical protein
MLPHDPIPWLLEQEGLSAVRARRLLGIDLRNDADEVRTLERDLAKSQFQDGSFDQSPMKTAGVLNLLDDLRASDSEQPTDRAASYLISLLQSQPGYERARTIAPGSLQTPCDLCGFFGPYKDRTRPESMADGAREMNFYREYEPLLGPQKPVRTERRSSLDRAGPTSCYSWGLIPLSYTVETLCRAGYAEDERLQPAVNALLGVQRDSGGWCRNLGGHPTCTAHGFRWLGRHPRLRESEYAVCALGFVHKNTKGNSIFPALQALASFPLSSVREIIREMLADLAPRQRKNGTFGKPHQIKKVAAALVADRAPEIRYG